MMKGLDLEPPDFLRGLCSGVGVDVGVGVD